VKCDPGLATPAALVSTPHNAPMVCTVQCWGHQYTASGEQFPTHSLLGGSASTYILVLVYAHPSPAIAAGAQAPVSYVNRPVAALPGPNGASTPQVAALDPEVRGDVGASAGCLPRHPKYRTKAAGARRRIVRGPCPFQDSRARGAVGISTDRDHGVAASPRGCLPSRQGWLGPPKVVCVALRLLCSLLYHTRTQEEIRPDKCHGEFVLEGGGGSTQGTSILAAAKAAVSESL